MIEMLILAMVLAKVVQNATVDIAFAVRGKPSPRMVSRSAKRPTGAAYSYFSDLWNDSWTNARTKHAARQARRQDHAPEPAKPRGAATVFFAGLFQDGRRRARRSWDGAWERADEKRREKATRPRPGQDTVPGKVVPNQDESRDRPQDETEDETEDRPRPDPHAVPHEDGTGQDEPAPQDDNHEPPTCTKCGTAMTTAPNIGDPISYDGTGIYRCPACDYKIRRSPETTDDSTQEGPTAMTTTIPTDTEVIGLDPAISYCDTTVQACVAMQHSLEHTEAAIAAGGVTGVASQAFAQAKELFGQIATVMQGAGQEFVAHKAIQEAYDANPGAGTREFVTGGR